MTRQLAREFSEEVEGYRRALVYFARQCEWDEFKKRAGSLFDYVEAVEATERERRFFRIFSAILATLVAAVAVMFLVGPDIPAWTQYRNGVILACLAASSFEIFFFLNFRWYAAMRMASFRKRRDGFIRNIERDFRSFAVRREEVRS